MLHIFPVFPKSLSPKGIKQFHEELPGMFINSLDSQPIKSPDSLSVGKTEPGISIFKKFQHY